MSTKKKKGNNFCFPGCSNKSNNSPGITFYRFSTQVHERHVAEKWIKTIKKKNSDGSQWQPSKYSRICCTHFFENKKSEHPMSPSFIPTIFPSQFKNQPSVESMTSKKERLKRRLTRNTNAI